MNTELCPECGGEMAQGSLPFQRECQVCGFKKGRGVRTQGLESNGRRDAAVPERYRATIYCLPLLWMSQVCPQAIDFEFAVELATWGMRNNGYKYQLVTVFAANGFPWPSDLVEAMRKYSIRNSVPLTKQLRDAIANAIVEKLGVTESEIKYLKAVITRATLSLREETRNRRSYSPNG
ncbi:hypothetical protein LCGC14_0353350 [marine sediment metagenome]|uniref:Uncharacterized protein n=1 Tax=marine sediment metagenome TaxID=412755 RepID=A0A0F9WI59_9ZZZZ